MIKTCQLLTHFSHRIQIMYSGHCRKCSHYDKPLNKCHEIIVKNLSNI